jgi:hypothetical protein
MLKGSLSVSPVTGDHDQLTYYVRQFLRPIWNSARLRVRSAPFVMRLPEFPKRRREPDLFVFSIQIYELKDTYMDGFADICGSSFRGQ